MAHPERLLLDYAARCLRQAGASPTQLGDCEYAALRARARAMRAEARAQRRRARDQQIRAAHHREIAEALAALNAVGRIRRGERPERLWWRCRDCGADGVRAAVGPDVCTSCGGSDLRSV